MNDELPRYVRGLPVPPLLAELHSADRWRHPGDGVLRRILPWFEFPLVFLVSADEMRRESRSLDYFANDDRLSEMFRIKHGRSSDVAVVLPWLDADKAFYIAVNRIPGDDVAIALDFRGDPLDPPVVASDIWTDRRHCSWRPVASAFSEFARMLAVSADGPYRPFPPGDSDGPSAWSWVDDGAGTEA